MKPGYKTTEFWITVAGQLLAALAIFGVIKQPDQVLLDHAAASAITSIAALAASGATIFHYVASRTGLKNTELERQTGELFQSTALAQQDRHND